MSFPLEAEFKVVGADELKASLQEIWQSYKDGAIDVKELSRALKDQSAEMRAMQQTYRMVQQQQKLAYHDFQVLGNTVKSIGNIAREGTQIWQAYNVAQIRVQDATRNVADAQENYNEKVRKFGVNSEDAHKALKRLEDAQRDLAKAQQDNIYGMISMGTQIIGLIGNLPSLIKQFCDLKDVLDKINLTSALGGVAGAIKGALGATGVTVGVTAATLAPFLALAAAVIGAQFLVQERIAATTTKEYFEEQRRLAGGALPEFQTGGILPYTGLFYGHAGERVIPKSETHSRTIIIEPGAIIINGSKSPYETAEATIDALRRRGVL